MCRGTQILHVVCTYFVLPDVSDLTPQVDDLDSFATQHETASSTDSLLKQQTHCEELYDLLLDPDFLDMTVGVLRTSESRLYPGTFFGRHFIFPTAII